MRDEEAYGAQDELPGKRRLVGDARIDGIGTPMDCDGESPHSIVDSQSNLDDAGSPIATLAHKRVQPICYGSVRSSPLL